MEGIDDRTIAFLVLISIFVIAFFSYWKKIKDKKEQTYKKVGTIEKVNLGKYLYGLQYQPDEMTNNVECCISNDSFVLLNFKGEEIARIPRTSVNDIFIDDKSRISQRLTVTRILTLGIFSLAAPKKKKLQEYCLVIDWDSQDGSRNNTIFEFSGANSNALANQAFNTLKKYISPKVERLKDDEKKCPYCAEVIKKEAKICRYCHQQL